MLNPNQSAEFPETKRKLLDAGVSLMRARGFNATTVDDICAEAGVTKGGFFYYFKSKEDIAKAAVARFQELKAQEFQDAPFRQFADPLERVFGRLDFALETSGGEKRLTKGCLFGMFAQELSFTNPELRDVCNSAFVRIARDFEADLVAAKALHAPQAGFDPYQLAYLYVSIIQGSLVMAKVSGSNDILAQNIHQFRRHLEGLFGLKSGTDSQKPAGSADHGRN